MRMSNRRQLRGGGALIKIDIRGQVCPNATGAVFAAMHRLPGCEALEVTSDYPPARTTIPMLAHQLGATCAIRELEGGQFIVVIRRSDTTEQATSQEDHHD